MQRQLEQYFGCKVKIAEYKNKLQLPIFMTMRDIMMVEIYGVNFAIIDVVKEMELNVAAYSCAMKSHFRKFGNQMSGSGNHLCEFTRAVFYLDHTPPAWTCHAQHQYL